MIDAPGAGRTDSASRVLKAPPQRIYQALVDPQAVAQWRPPEGMTMKIAEFDAREGGAFRLSLTYTDPGHGTRGKTSEHSDEVQGRFLKLVVDQQMIESIDFISDDPGFAGTMTITTTLAPAPGGTRVTIVCENVPQGITQSDHEAGMASTLQNLSAFVET